MFGHKINAIVEKLLFRFIQILRYLIKMDLNKSNCDREIEQQNSQEDLSPDFQKPCKNCKIICKTSSQCENCQTMLVKCQLVPRCRSNTAVLSADTDGKLEMNIDFDMFNLRQLYQMSSYSLRSINSSCNRSPRCKTSASNAPTHGPVDSKTFGGSLHSLKIQIANMPTLKEAYIEDQNTIEFEVRDVGRITIKESVQSVSENNNNSSQKFNFEILKCNEGDWDKTKKLSHDNIIVISSDEDSKSPETGNSELEIEENFTHNGDNTTDVIKTSNQTCNNSTKCTQIPVNRSETTTQTQVSVEMHPPRLFQIPSSSSSSSGHNVSASRSPSAATPNTSHKQRQWELHRIRIQVEKKRLQLLEIKLKRERDEMKREKILFERKLGAKTMTLYHDLEDENEV